MARRSERLNLTAWLVLGLTVGVLGSIAWRALHTERLDLERLAGERERPRPKAAEKTPLERCRDAVSAARGYPEWVAAEASCRGAVQSPEAGELHAVAKRELECARQLGAARDMKAQGRPASVLQALMKFDPECREAGEARQLLLQARDELAGPLTKQCLELAEKRDWAWAATAETCDAAAGFRCWDRSRWEGLPPNKRPVLFGPLPKDGWRPGDPVHLALLRAREKTGRPTPFRCPRPLLFELEELSPTELARVRPEFRERFPDPWVGLALEDYLAGKANEARDLLQRRTERGTPEGREEAARLLRELTRAREGYRVGLERLPMGELQSAAPHFLAALEADQRLVLGEESFQWRPERRAAALASVESYLRRSIQENAGRRARDEGDKLNREGNRTAACAAWRLGLELGPNHELTGRVKRACGD